MTEEQTLDASECLNFGPDCSGPVDYHFVGMNATRAFPRCEKHLRDRLEQYENSIERETESSTPPDWFDPSYAGESWDED